MRVYRLEIEIKTPLVVTESQVTNVLKHTSEYLSGSTIRGAFLTMLKREGRKEADLEINDPTLIFHPAYPMEDNFVSIPAHSLVYECKLCKGIFTYLKPEVLKDGFDISQCIPIVCPKCYEKYEEKGEGSPLFTTKSIGGKPIIVKNGIIRKCDITYTLIESIGINRDIGSVEIGMIYGYVAISIGSRFKSIIVDPFERLSGIKDKFALYIGRGAARGLGHVETKIIEDNNFIDNEINRISKITQKLDKKIIFEALSPVFDLKSYQMIGDKFITTPNIPLIPNGLIPYNILNGKNYLLVGMTKVSGFSMVSNLPKISIFGAKPGSLFFYQFKNDIDYEEIVKCELYGFGLFSYGGCNILRVYDFE